MAKLDKPCLNPVQAGETGGGTDMITGVSTRNDPGKPYLEKDLMTDLAQALSGRVLGALSLFLYCILT
jgi:hypothetical protein